MQITLDGVSVDGRHAPALATIDLAWSTGECVLVAAEPGHGHTALALVATGRFVPSAGTVRLVPALAPTTTAALREVSAVVDVPGVNEPDDALTVADVVAEGLALAGRRSLPPDVTRWLADHSLVADRGRRMDQVPGVVRTAVLAALAAEREGVRFLVLTLPDRHGGEADGWWEVARTLATSGLGVLVQCSRASARALGVDLPPALGSLHTPPVVALRERPEPPDAPDGPAPTDPTDPTETTETTQEER